MSHALFSCSACAAMPAAARHAAMPASALPPHSSRETSFCVQPNLAHKFPTRCLATLQPCGRASSRSTLAAGGWPYSPSGGRRSRCLLFIPWLLWTQRETCARQAAPAPHPCGWRTAPPCGTSGCSSPDSKPGGRSWDAAPMARRPRRNASAGNPCRPNSTCRAEAAGCLLRRGLRDTALPGGPQQPAPQVKPNKQPVKAPTRPSTPRPPKECALAARPSLGSKLPLQKERPKRQLLTDSKAHSHYPLAAVAGQEPRATHVRAQENCTWPLCSPTRAQPPLGSELHGSSQRADSHSRPSVGSKADGTIQALAWATRP